VDEQRAIVVCLVSFETKQTASFLGSCSCNEASLLGSSDAFVLTEFTTLRYRFLHSFTVRCWLFPGYVAVIRTEPYQVLIADDDAGFRDVLKDIFQPYFSLIEAVSGEEAVDYVSHVRVDLLVLDMNMDELTGLQTIRLVKRIDSHLPCILVTADATDQLRQEAEAADAWSVLAKPVRKLELLQTVSTAIGSAYGDSSILSDLSSLN